MKVLLIAFLLCVFASSLHAQSQKTVIYCTVDPIGRTDYGDLAKLLPDSVKTKVLVDPRKEYNLHKVEHVLLWMTMHGWKLVTIKSEVNGGIINTSFIYFLSREINLDTHARALFLQNLLNSEKKPKK